MSPGFPTIDVAHAPEPPVVTVIADGGRAGDRGGLKGKSGGVTLLMIQVPLAAVLPLAPLMVTTEPLLRLAVLEV